MIWATEEKITEPRGADIMLPVVDLMEGSENLSPQ
jgi:hypothetical protein